MFDENALIDQMAAARQILCKAVREYRPAKVIALFSGGHDSCCSTHVASATGLVDFVGNINTTIGIERTRQYVRETCESNGWKLRVYEPPMNYEAIVRRWGFPGPGGHHLIYQRLKERCVRQMQRESKKIRSDRVMFITGCRLSESTRRMGHAKPIQKDGARIWCAPIIHWNDDDKRRYMEHFSIPRNPIVDQLCMSGECLCGAFAKPGERVEIRRACPAAYAEIERLETIARDAGVHSAWGTRPPKQPKCKDRPGQMHLCWSCVNSLPTAKGTT